MHERQDKGETEAEVTKNRCLLFLNSLTGLIRIWSGGVRSDRCCVFTIWSLKEHRLFFIYLFFKNLFITNLAWLAVTWNASLEMNVCWVITAVADIQHREYCARKREKRGRVFVWTLDACDITIYSSLCDITLLWCPVMFNLVILYHRLHYLLHAGSSSHSKTLQ